MGYRDEERPKSNAELIRYLESWGLREFRDEASYYHWQRSVLSEEELRLLQRLIENRHGGEEVDCDIEFYDFLARQDLVSVLYSQRFDYFFIMGSYLLHRIPPANCVLDFGCGVGILTIFFAEQYPDIEFVGIDRSSQSIARARLEADNRQLANIRFEVSQVPQHSLSGRYDLILSLQALFQAEREPGLPSNHWRTFQRRNDPQQQEQLESRTGLRGRLDNLLAILRPAGRMIIFEKTWNLGRRIFFQRALESRGLFAVADPVFCRYHLLDEEVLDGPVYEVARHPEGKTVNWDEEPYRKSGETLYRCTGLPASRMGGEMALGQVVETVTGVHSRQGSWVFRFGLWNQIFSWGLYEAGSGFTGLIIGGTEDKDFLFQLIETVNQLNEQDFERLVRDCWDKLTNTDDERTVPCYENHQPSAQNIYEALPSKNIQQESMLQDKEGREMHIELGTSQRLVYLYWADTFDQRQIVIMEEERGKILKDYYQESLEHSQGPPA